MNGWMAAVIPADLLAIKISSEAKIISIADVYDAITSTRTYKLKTTPFGALDILANELFEKLDPVTGLTFIKKYAGLSYREQCDIKQWEKSQNRRL